MMDALSDVLTHVRLKQARWACFLAGSPWSVSFAQAPACVRFLYVVHGEIWLTVEDDAPVRLTRGMLAVLPHGQRVVIGDRVNRKSIRFEELARSTHHITCGGGIPSEANIVYGAFEIEDPTPLLASLPPLVQIREPLPSFSQNLEFISRELDSHRPGANVVLTRMADVIFVQMLRACVETLPDGIFAALRDKHVATALGLVHQRPAHPWTTALLADEVGLSRSAFAVRFGELVGEPPLAYLTRLRMQRAALVLRDGATIAKASELAGYASEASFSYAFRQWAGIAPGEYRKRARSAVSVATSMVSGPPGDERG